MALSADPVCVDDMVASPFNQMAHGFSGPFIKPGSKHRYISRKLMVANPLKDYDWNPRLGKLFYIFCRKTCRTDNDSIILTADDLGNKFRGISVSAKRNQVAGIICVLVHFAYNTAEIFIGDMIGDKQELIALFSL